MAGHSIRISRRKKWLIAGGSVLLILAIFAGAFFWYVSNDYRAEDATLEVMARDSGITVQDNLTIYGALNQSMEDHSDYTENIMESESGNHAQFGSCGPQKGDLDAAISAQEQQARTVAAVEAFLRPADAQHGGGIQDVF